MPGYPAAASHEGCADLQDFASYHATVSRSVVALDAYAAEPGRFRGRLTAGASGDIHVFDVSADGHTVHRTSELISHASSRYLKFSLIRTGGGLIVQDGRETTLHPGDMTLYDTGRPYSLVFGQDIRMSIVMFPSELLDIPPGLLRGITGTRLRGPRGLGPLIRPYLSTLGQCMGDANGYVAQRLFRTAFDMVGTLLTSEVGFVARPTRADLMRRILDYIDAHLAEPDLGPAQIAASHFISVRRLQALFSTHKTTVSTLVRTRRLNRCYDDLVNPALADRSVTRIAVDNGFVSSAHFSRTFRASFGVSPSMIRPVFDTADGRAPNRADMSQEFG